MSFNDKDQANNGKSWWSRDRDKAREAAMDKRLEAIRRINDPGTWADEILKGARILLPLLLLYSGFLGFFNYWKFFEQSFHEYVAAAMAIVLAVVIEWGKYRAAMWALRIVFFQGGSYIGRSPANTFVFVGLLLLGAATFTMSWINSTRGARELATMLSKDRNETKFAPDTAKIDAEIAATQATIDKAPRITDKKGQEVYQNSKAVRVAQERLVALGLERAKSDSIQRVDWAAGQADVADKSTRAGEMVMASGGWVELLQGLLLIVCVSCERILGSRADRRGQSSGNGSPTTSNGHRIVNGPTTYQNSATDADRRPIGFYQRAADPYRHEALTEPTSPPSPPPPPVNTATAAPDQNDGEVLFKQTGDLFKQIIEGGRVIGLMYKKRDAQWQPLKYADIQSRWRIYRARYDEAGQKGREVSPAVSAGLEQWEWAMYQFEEGVAELTRANVAGREAASRV